MVASNSIREIMTSNPTCVFPEDPYKKVKKIFKQNNFHHIPVVKKSGEIIGIISKMDCLSKFKKVSKESSGKKWSKKYFKALKAEEIMQESPLTLEPEDHVGLAADIFMANQFHALPILEENQVVGIVTTHDLIKFAFQKLD